HPPTTQTSTLSLHDALPISVFPAANGKIGYTTGGDIWTINPDGTGNANITNSAITESCALWAPNGGKIAFFREPGIDTAAYVAEDRKSTRLNSSHVSISYAV